MSIVSRRSTLAPTLTYLEDSLGRRLIFFTGKGGVGKSTLAWATALACRRQGRKVAVVGWQPQGKESPQWQGPKGWDVPWIGLETLQAFREYALTLIKFEKLYDTVLDNKVLRTFVQAAPGLADSVVAGKLWDLVDRAEFDTIVVDMPSSGHARSFFNSPLGLRKIFKVGFIARDTERVCELFASPHTRLDLIALPEELPLKECRELKTSLQSLHPFSFGFLHVNRCLPPWLATAPNERPGGLNDKHTAFLDGFNTRLVEQMQSLQVAASIHQPVLNTPLLPCEGWQDGIEAVARHLEEA